MDAKKRNISVWGNSPAGNIYAKKLTPGTREYFETTRELRNNYEMKWLFPIIPFKEMKGKKVLEIGFGAGYDAYEFIINGAGYLGIDITPENVDRIKKHLGFYHMVPDVMQGDAENLPFSDNSFDIVYSNGVLHHTPDIERSFRESHRVLVNEGVFWVIVYNKNSIFYWLTLFLFDHILGLGFLKSNFNTRLARIEYTMSGNLPLVNVYTKRDLKKILEKTGFTLESIWVRKLTREDLPGIPLINRSYLFIPQRILDRIGEKFGWHVIVKARKLNMK